MCVIFLQVVTTRSDQISFRLHQLHIDVHDRLLLSFEESATASGRMGLHLFGVHLHEHMLILSTHGCLYGQKTATSK